MHPYTFNPRAETLRWLDIAEKLLTSRDLIGCKTFATRARDSDPRLEDADQIIAVADTLLASEKQISPQHLDWYAILQIDRQTHDTELIGNQYRRLGLLLNPNRNKFSFAEHAFKLVSDAWLVLSNPSTKFQFDSELANSNHNVHFNFVQQEPQLNSNSTHFNFIQEHSEQQHQFLPVQQHQFLQPIHQQQHHQTLNHHQQQHEAQSLPWQQLPLHKPQQPSAQPQPIQPQTQPALPRSNPFPQHLPQPQPLPQQLPLWSVPQPEPQPLQRQEEVITEEEGVGNDDNANNDVNGDESLSFWTACPYCFNMYEYPKRYAECTLRCQNCKRAFHAVMLAGPPAIVEGEEAYFSCWGVFPFAASSSYLEKNQIGGSNWKPFSAMFPCP